jgi:hypothetical protein
MLSPLIPLSNWRMARNIKYICLRARKTLREGFAPSLLHSPLQPENPQVCLPKQAGEGSGVRYKKSNEKETV